MDKINSLFQQKGYRMTKQREQVYKTLTCIPQSAQQIFSLLNKQKSTIDKVTVYRTLNCLAKLGLVSQTQFQDQIAKYEIVKKNGHHHHLVCNNCGLVEDVPVNENFFINKIKKQTDFLISSHILEFFGICHKCQKH
jgi:Fur family transcriptional regulator, ferric uptake regulator